MGFRPQLRNVFDQYSQPESKLTHALSHDPGLIRNTVNFRHLCTNLGTSIEVFLIQALLA